VQKAQPLISHCHAISFNFLCILLIYNRDGVALVEHVEAGNVLALKEKEKRKK
jgi:hypothetical protein